MKRNIIFHITPEEFLRKLDSTSSDNPFAYIDGKDIQDFGFNVEPIDGYEETDNFPNCCGFHMSLSKSINEWFEIFPYCCEIHRNLAKKYWFNKNDYIDRPNKILDCISYSEFFIKKMIEDENWFKNIADYIEYNFHSFGTPSIGSHLYSTGIKHFLKNTIIGEKANKLIEYINSYNCTKVNKEIDDFNVLHRTFQKWINSFPDLYFFDDIKKTLTDKFPINIILQEHKYNPYIKMVSSRSLNNEQLIEVLISMTRSFLQNINSTELINSGQISDLNKHQFSILNENHKIRQSKLLKEYSSSELKYLEIIEIWLKNEISYFSEIINLFNINDNKNINNALNTISSKLEDIEGILNYLSKDQKNIIEYILNNFNDSDINEFRSDIELDSFKNNLAVLINTISKENTVEITPNNLLKNDSEISIKHKLKFVISLVFIKYEGEIELNNKQLLPKSWKAFKELLFKK